MIRGSNFCPECGSILNEGVYFCPKCGCQIGESSPTEREGIFSGLKSKVKIIGDKTSDVGRRARGMVSQEKASDAVRNMLNVVTQVARDLKNELPPDMIKAVDLSAEVSFIAFSIGVSIDLEQLEKKKDS